MAAVIKKKGAGGNQTKIKQTWLLIVGIINKRANKQAKKKQTGIPVAAIIKKEQISKLNKRKMTSGGFHRPKWGHEGKKSVQVNMLTLPPTSDIVLQDCTIIKHLVKS